MMSTRSLVTASLPLVLAAVFGVCLSAPCSGQMPPMDSGEYAAKVITLTGQVSVLKDTEPWALQVGDAIQVKQLILTGPDGQATFQVSDGSTFSVYPNSRVVFRKNAPNWRDLLDVLVGRVRVQIEHLYGPNPNRVLTPTAVISVRGTVFDISVDGDDETTDVEVEEGTVEVRHALLPNGNPRILNTGDTLRVYRDQPIASNGIDKGLIAKRALRMIVDAINTWEARIPKSGGGICSACTGTHGKPAPPPTAPPPPPPPPPPPVSAPPPPGLPMFSSSGDPFVTVLVVHEPEGRTHKIFHAVIQTVMRMALGQQPGGDVLRELQRMREAADN